MSAASIDFFQIRRWYTYREETLLTESGKPADGEPVVKAVIGALIHNPYANGKFTASLDDVVRNSAALAGEFGRRTKAALDNVAPASFGKACLVGMAGEYEHGNAFVTATFMDPLRDILGGGKAWVASTGKRGGPGTSIDIPLAHRHALYVRSHYDTVTVTFPDGPAPDEILVLFATATRGRLHARLGGLSEHDAQCQDGLR
jgi:hypothetical protein